jgi:hypothetical protein
MFDIFSVPAFKLDDAQRAKAYKIMAIASTILIAAVAYKVGRLAGLNVPAESPEFEHALQSRMALLRFVQGVGLYPFALFSSLLAWKGFSRSPLGKRLTIWDQKVDVTETCAAKLHNAGGIVMALIVGSLLFWAQVLR